jgi:hypothetical protein
MKHSGGEPAPLQRPRGEDRTYTAAVQLAVDQRNAEEPDMSAALVRELTEAVQVYLDLMYDCDVTKFDKIFTSTCQLHGYRNGRMQCWPAAEYKEILAARKSPKSQGAPREESILLIDFASPTQALVKVRLRINSDLFFDHLTFHRIDGRWLITSKGYHLED